MKRTNRLMLVIGVALAAVSFVAVLALGGFGQQAPQATPVPDVPVVVAVAELPLGTQVSAEDLTMTTKPQTEATDTYQDPQQIVGKVVRRTVAQGAALQVADFETELTVPELVQQLQPGLRAIAVPLSKVNSVGALLQGGDFVDVLISMEELDQLNPISIPNPSPSPGVDGFEPYTPIDDFLNNTTVKVVVQNVQVLAAITEPPADPNSQNQPVPEGAVVVLLAVTPQQAEIVRFAQLDGNISLILRSPADAAAPAIDTTGITLKQLVDVYGVLPPAVVGPTSTVTP